jgi:putative endonuclease
MSNKPCSPASPPAANAPLSKLHFGLQIEAQALRRFLDSAPEGTRLLARNFRWRGGEIDLIFEEPSRQRPGFTELVFVEVRARLEGAWVDGISSVGHAKLLRLRRGTELYLSRYRGRARTARLDLMAWDGHSWEHWRDACPSAT